ncbi:uncharacterized protein LOC121391241 [Gigantopelta aegis]|uniref:uncharacterized protein LOC121391241 n=1 Tax=Gigantopelta aegis TaxID=1735272 RepID=UPI001B8884A7|nr:uncharacterized protein LOC121391241 [Gigantopelta aegis]
MREGEMCYEKKSGQLFEESPRSPVKVSNPPRSPVKISNPKNSEGLQSTSEGLQSTKKSSEDLQSTKKSSEGLQSTKKSSEGLQFNNSRKEKMESSQESTSVGDSPICVYCPHTQQVIEATIGCHPEDGDRNVHISGGALGPAIGSLPDLDNLTLAYMPVHPDDIVLLMSDGISDNLSPRYVQSFESNDPRHSQSSNPENCIEQGIDIKRKSKGDPEFAAFVKQMPGKLDHATIVTYKVGRH